MCTKHAVSVCGGGGASECFRLRFLRFCFAAHFADAHSLCFFLSLSPSPSVRHALLLPGRLLLAEHHVLQHLVDVPRFPANVAGEEPGAAAAAHLSGVRVGRTAGHCGGGRCAGQPAGGGEQRLSAAALRREGLLVLRSVRSLVCLLVSSVWMCRMQIEMANGAFDSVCSRVHSRLMRGPGKCRMLLSERARARCPVGSSAR